MSNTASPQTITASNTGAAVPERSPDSREFEKPHAVRKFVGPLVRRRPAPSVLPTPPIKDSRCTVGAWLAHWRATTLAVSDRKESTRELYGNLSRRHMETQPFGAITPTSSNRPTSRPWCSLCEPRPTPEGRSLAAGIRHGPSAENRCYPGPALLGSRISTTPAGDGGGPTRLTFRDPPEIGDVSTKIHTGGSPTRSVLLAIAICFETYTDDSHAGHEILLTSEESVIFARN